MRRHVFRAPFAWSRLFVRLFWQEDRGFNEFSFDEFEKQMAEEEEGVLAAGDEDGDDDEADLFG